MLNNHVRILDPIPDTIFNNAKEEILNINWDEYVKFDNRATTSKNLFFGSSKTIHLRTHDTSKYTPSELNIGLLNSIVECKDTIFKQRFPHVSNLINYVVNLVDGYAVGKIMIIDLLPNGIVNDHIDPGEYFLNHRRFHVPITTNTGSNFFGKLGSTAIHMPEGTLCQLNNRNTHSVKNESHEHRIHLLIDIATNNDKFSFGDDDYPSCQKMIENNNNNFLIRPLLDTNKDFTLKKTAFSINNVHNRFKGKYLIKYAWLTHEDPNWIHNYFTNGTELNINVRALTMHKLKPFWDDYARYFRTSYDAGIFKTRIKLHNYDNNSIDYISAWDANAIDEFDSKFDFTQELNTDNFYTALEPFGFKFSGARFYVNDNELLSFINYAKQRTLLKDNCRFEAQPSEKTMQELIRNSL